MTTETSKQFIIESNNEIFTRGKYNSIDVIIRDVDGYINATILCNQFGRSFRKLQDNKTSWRLYYEAFEKRMSSVVTTPHDYIYELKKGYKHELHGQYVHPRLVNYIVIWASAGYAVTVAETMDTIDEYTRVANKSLLETKNEIISELQAKISELRGSLEYKERVANIQDAKAESMGPKMIIDNDKYRRITIMEWTDTDMKISANNSAKFKNTVAVILCPTDFDLKRSMRFVNDRKPYNVIDKNKYNDIVNELIKYGGIQLDRRDW